MVVALARLGSGRRASEVEAADPLRSALPARMWTPPCGSACVTSSINLSRYSDAVASRSPPASITMSIRKSLFAWKGSLLSTWWRMDMLLRGGKARAQGVGAGSLARPIGDTIVQCRVLTSVSLQHGHLATRNSYLSPEISSPQSQTLTQGWF